MQDTAKLASNENPFGPSPKAVTAARKALEKAQAYPDRNDDALCDALAAFHGRDLTRGEFFAANGGLEVLSLIEDALIGAGERAIICPPCFGEYAASLSTKGVLVDRVPLTGAHYQPDVEAILGAVTKDTRLVYLCNPNNPTGTWFGEDVLSAVLDRLPGKVTLIYDEVYFQFATQGGLPDAIGHVMQARNLVMVHSFSKAYGLAGMRLGYGIGHRELVAQIRKRKRPFHLGAAGIAAATAALADVDHLARTVDNNDAQRLRLTRRLQDLGLQVTPSQANFVMFRCPGPLDAKGLTAALMQAGVIVKPAFDLPTQIRVTVGQADDNDRFLMALGQILKG